MCGRQDTASGGRTTPSESGVGAALSAAGGVGWGALLSAGGVGDALGAVEGSAAGVTVGAGVAAGVGVAEGAGVAVGVGVTGTSVRRPVEVLMPSRAASAGL